MPSPMASHIENGGDEDEADATVGEKSKFRLTLFKVDGRGTRGARGRGGRGMSLVQRLRILQQDSTGSQDSPLSPPLSIPFLPFLFFPLLTLPSQTETAHTWETQNEVGTTHPSPATTRNTRPHHTRTRG